MAISIISSLELTASGNLSIPDGCERIYALVIGSEDAPKINGFPMAKICSQPATTKVLAVAIYQFEVSEDNVEAPFVISGISNSIIYAAGSDEYRPGALFGNNDAGSYSGDLPTSTSDLVLGVLAGMIGPSALTGDGGAFTYIKNATFYKTGYKTPGDSVLTCVASDSGVSAGYYIDGGSITHPAELISEAYETWDPVNHYVAWLYLYTESSGVKIYGKYDNGVATGDRIGVAPGYSPPPPYSYTAYVYHYHPAVYSEEWEEELPDIWVPGGELAQVNACFASIQLTSSAEFVPRVIIGG